MAVFLGVMPPLVPPVTWRAVQLFSYLWCDQRLDHNVFAPECHAWPVRMVLDQCVPSCSNRELFVLTAEALKGSRLWLKPNALHEARCRC